MYIVIECWPDPKQATIVVDPESGENKVFTEKVDAEHECDDCQEGLVLQI